MKYLCAELSTKSLSSELLFLFTGDSRKSLNRRICQFDKTSQTEILAQARTGRFSGEPGEALQILLPRSSTPIVILIGTGKKNANEPRDLNKLVKPVFHYAKAFRAKRIHLLGFMVNKCGLFSELLSLGFYPSPSLKSHSKKEDEYRAPNSVTYLLPKSELGQVKKDLKHISVIERATGLTRDLANQPGNLLTPARFAEKLVAHFKSTVIDTDLLSEKKLKALRMNALLAVGQGSAEESCLLVLKYRCKKKSAPSLAVVGKGVTFDTGGISIKPAAKMEDMKFDMSGAAAVAGLFAALADIQPQANITGFIPLAENMPGRKALKPGDVVTAYNGKTIEIINTDAEGRLILADALAYAADRYKPDYMIDLATLTGAVVVALGNKAAGVFSNNDQLVKKLVNAGESCGERVWPMPLWDDYREELDSGIADIKNLGGRWAGSISAAKFLEEFVGSTKWAHIDIAGTAYGVSGRNYYDKGATGFGTRLLLRYIEIMIR